MRLYEAYMEVAKRSVEAAEAALNGGVHELSCFLSYHAFESAGGALCTSFGNTYPRSHRRKINQFTSVAAQRRYRLGVATIAIALTSVRETSLYPEKQPDGSARAPAQAISGTFAKKTAKRVRGIVSKVEGDL